MFSLHITIFLFLHFNQHPARSFQMLLDKAGKRRRDRRITRRALQAPSMSPFQFLFGSGCDQSLITTTGFDHRTFRPVLDGFQQLYHRFTPYSNDGTLRVFRNREITRGRPRLLSASQCLGLFLTWHRTRGSTMTLCMLFGVTHSVASLYIRFARRLIYKMLVTNVDARVTMPTASEVEQFKQAFQEKHSLLTDVYCVANGLKLHLQQAGDCVIQNVFYNGWTHDHYVGNVFVFSPNGKIIACAVNAPGAFHDSTIAEWGKVYQKLERKFDETGGKCVVDSAFCREMYPFLIKSSQDYLGATGEHPELMMMFRQATSARQGSEWGMRAFKGTYPRLQDRMIYEETGKRKLILLTTVLLFNLRSKLVGVNQILNTYMHLESDANRFLHNEAGV